MFSKIKNWFHNYWYYYKWGVIIVCGFAAIFIICFAQCASREKYDVKVSYTGPHFITASEKKGIANAFEQIMDDYNGDGKTVVDIMDMTAFTDDQIKDAIGTNADDETLIKYAPYTVDRVRERFLTSVAGDGYICFVDKYWYDLLKNNGALASLSEILGYAPDNMIDEYSVYLRDLDFCKFYSESIGKLPEDTIVCFRKMPATSALTGQKEAKKVYGYSVKLIKAMFDFKLG